MVPDKFNMVDMEGIDILFRYGDTIPGLYQKLVESIAQCRYQCLYNWFFDGVLIPPTYVEMTVVGTAVWIGEGVSVDEEDTLGFLAPGLKSVTGAIAHITDALARKADNIVCYINPMQDLHGYDRPWSAGSGKNLLPMTVEGIKAANSNISWNNNSGTTLGITFTILTDAGDNVIGIKCNGTATGVALLWLGSIQLSNGDSVKVAANTEVNSEVFFRISGPGKGAYNINVNSGTYTATSDVEIWGNIRIGINQTVSNKVFYPVVCRSTETDTAFEPYSNICPITGWTGLNLYHEAVYDPEADPVIIDNWQSQVGTVYGGSRNIAAGKLIVTDAEIESYDGEELPGAWISSMDMYAEGTTPTTGAQVVYKLAEPIIYDLTAPQLPTLFQGENNIWHDANGDTSVTYWYNKI